LFSKRNRAIIPVGNLKVEFPLKEKPDVLQGTLALMVLKTRDWEQTAAIIARFFKVKAEDLA
jgi:hypothetical protein